jgi:hypothetical protein
VFKPKTGGSAFADSDSEKIFFTANAGVGGAQMWVTDGQNTSRAFEQTHNAIDIDAVATNSDYPAQLAIYSDTLYFSASKTKLYNVLSASELAAYSGSSSTSRAIVVEDVDDVNFSNVYHIDIFAEKGVLTLADVSGLKFTKGDGYSDQHMSFSSDLPHLNAAFAVVTYTSKIHQSGEDVILVVVNDTAIVDDRNMTGASHLVEARIPIRIAAAGQSGSS